MTIVYQSPKSNNNAYVSFRIDLNVNFNEKDSVKRLGGRWDPEKKTWYVIIDHTRSINTYKKWLKSPILE